MFRLGKVLFLIALSSLTVEACTSDKSGAGNDAAGTGGGSGGSSDNGGSADSGTAGSADSGTGGSADSGTAGLADSGTAGTADSGTSGSADSGTGGATNTADATGDGGTGTLGGAGGGQSDAGTVNWIVPFPALNKGVDVIAVDGTSVYWLTHGANWVYKVAKGGGTPVNLTPNSGSHWSAEYNFHLLGYMALDATGLYFTAGDLFHGFIVTLPPAGLPDGGAGKYVTQFPEGKSGGGELAVVGGTIYSLAIAGPNVGDIWSVPELGGTPSLFMDQAAVHLVDPITGAPIDAHASTFATDGQNVVFNNNGTYVVTVPVAGGTPVVLAPPSGTNAATAAGFYSFGPGSQPAISGGFVFTSNATSVWKVPVGAGSPTLLYSDCVNSVGTEVETDGLNVYFMVTGGGSSDCRHPRGLYKLRADGSSAGVPTLVIGDLTNLDMVLTGYHSLAIDATSVYIIAADGQAIISAPK